ncbi:MAG: efflux RND transporter periplasmic adaptor subunit [Deltaproteobacteria bacterium]|nr:efflux RND transporter periplasmic adaptor subunit [Deltaproteobacteria bacterium]
MIPTQGSLVTVFSSSSRLPMRFLLSLCLGAAAAGCAETAPAATEAPPPPVHAATIEAEAMTPTSTATAEILANRQSNMRSETAGRVVDVLVEAGDRVKEGQVLLRLDVGRPASAAQAANAAVAQSEARLNQAKREQARTKKLVQTGGLPEQRLDDAEDAVRLASAGRDAARAEARLARRGLTEAIVRAPFGGTVVERTVELGEYLAPGSPLLVLADTSLLKARVLLDPREAIDVTVGRTALISVYARPGEVFGGRVVRVGEVIDPRTRRLPVEIELDDHGGRLRPGLVAKFVVETGEPKRVIQVPLEGVFERFGSQHVYVIEDGLAHRRAIELGAVRAGFAEVVDGIEPGETVVIKGVTRVVDGSKVRVVPVASATASPAEQTSEP